MERERGEFLKMKKKKKKKKTTYLLDIVMRIGWAGLRDRSEIVDALRRLRHRRYFDMIPDMDSLNAFLHDLHITCLDHVHAIWNIASETARSMSSIHLRALFTI